MPWQTMLQLNPPIPVYVIDQGAGFAYGWFDISQDHDTLWLVCFNKTGEWWQVPQSKIRGVENRSLGRGSQGALFDE